MNQIKELVPECAHFVDVHIQYTTYVRTSCYSTVMILQIRILSQVSHNKEVCLSIQAYVLHDVTAGNFRWTTTSIYVRTL